MLVMSFPDPLPWSDLDGSPLPESPGLLSDLGASVGWLLSLLWLLTLSGFVLLLLCSVCFIK